MSVPTGAGNYPAGVTDNDPHFDLPSVGDDDGIEWRKLECGCLEFSDGAKSPCAEHLPAVCDPDHLNPAEGGNRASDDYW